MGLQQCLEGVVLYSNMFERTPGSFAVSPDSLHFFPSFFWKHAEVMPGLNHENGMVVGVCYPTVRDALIKDFLDHLQEMKHEVRWETVLKREIQRCAKFETSEGSEVFDRSLLLHGIAELRKDNQLKFFEEDVDEEELARVVVAEFLRRRGMGRKGREKMLKDMSRAIREDSSFCKHFHRLFEDVFSDNREIFSCPICQLNVRCPKHSQVLRRFPKLPLLVQRMIIAKLDKEDQIVLRATGWLGKELIDRAIKRPIVKRVQVKNNSYVPLKVSPTLFWRLRMQTPRCEMPIDGAGLPAHLFQLDLENATDLGKELVQFCQRNHVKHLSYGIHALSTSSAKWPAEVEKLLRRLEQLLPRLKSVQLVRISRDSKRQPHEHWKLTGFERKNTSFALVFKRV